MTIENSEKTPIVTTAFKYKAKSGECKEEQISKKKHTVDWLRWHNTPGLDWFEEFRVQARRVRKNGARKSP